MRVPRDVVDTVNAYLAFWAALRAVLQHNAKGPRFSMSSAPAWERQSEECQWDDAPGRCVPWQRVLGDEPAIYRSLRAAADDEIQLLR